MTEPFYIRQSRETSTPQEAREFFQQCTAEAQAEGAQLCRYSNHPDNEHLLLVECWRERVVADQGPLRWSLTYLALNPETVTQNDLSAKSEEA